MLPPWQRIPRAKPGQTLTISDESLDLRWLPPADVPLALLTFNLGVEAGQLGVVAVLLGLIAVWKWAAARVELSARLEERARIKCDQYWPSRGTESYGVMTVTLTDDTGASRDEGFALTVVESAPVLVLIVPEIQERKGFRTEPICRSATLLFILFRSGKGRHT